MIILKIKSKDKGDTHIFRDLSLKLPDRGLFFLVGPNGSGKSTLLSILAGRDSDYQGSFCLEGERLCKKTLEEYADYHVAYSPQDSLIFENNTVIENILIPFAKRKERKAQDILDSLGIGGLASNLAGVLSSGEQQRLAIARALYAARPILLADEPVSFLDAGNSEAILEALADYAKQNLVIVSTNEAIPSRYSNCPVISIVGKKAEVTNMPADFDAMENPPLLPMSRKPLSSSMLGRIFLEKPLTNILLTVFNALWLALAVFSGAMLTSYSQSVFTWGSESHRLPEYATISFLENGDAFPYLSACPKEYCFLAFRREINEGATNLASLSTPIFSVVESDAFLEGPLDENQLEFRVGDFPVSAMEIALPSHAYEELCARHDIESPYSSIGFQQAKALFDIRLDQNSGFDLCGVFDSCSMPILRDYRSYDYLVYDAMAAFSLFSTSLIADFGSPADFWMTSFCVNNEITRRLVVEDQGFRVEAGFLSADRELQEARPLSSAPELHTVLFCGGLFFAFVGSLLLAWLYSASYLRRFLILRMAGADRLSLARPREKLFLLLLLVSLVFGLAIGLGAVYVYQAVFLSNLLAFPTPFVRVGADAILMPCLIMAIAALMVFIILRHGLFRRDIGKLMERARAK